MILKNLNDPKNKEIKKKNRKVLFTVTFLTTLLLTVSTYAWLSSALNVKINFFQMSVSSNSGLFISLDGIDFSDSVNISMDSIIMDLKATYPNHTNQWSYALWPVSTNGSLSPNNDKFQVFVGDLIRTRTKNANGSTKRLLQAVQSMEQSSSTTNSYVAFDVFLKNQSGSPFPDNIFFDKSTFIDYQEDTKDEVRESMSGIINSLRIGVLKINHVPHKTPINEIQNMTCSNNCETTIYEPNYLFHSEESIETAKNYGIALKDGFYTNTYGIIREGKRLEHTSGHTGTGLPLNTENFALQTTIKNFEQPIFQILNGITKVRVYIWVEGQDIDSLETYSKGTSLDIDINFVKDEAGYE